MCQYQFYNTNKYELERSQNQHHIMPSALPALYGDDEKDYLDISNLFLEEAGDFFVTTIDSALTAFAYLNKENFDAVIPDYQMPKMDGIQVLVDLLTKFGQIPSICFTGKRARSGMMVSMRMLGIGERNRSRG